jgi:hypothetical protein
MLFKKKEWKKNQQAAIELLDDDPAKALELLDLAISEAPADGAKSPRTGLLELRVRTYKRLGRAEEARADMEEVVAALTPELARVEREIAERQGDSGILAMPTSGLLGSLGEREDLLRRMERPAEQIASAQQAYLEQLEVFISKTKNHLFLTPLLDARAAVLERMGRPIDGARARLFSAEVLLAFSGDERARVEITVAPVYFAKYGLRGLEYGKAFTGSYAKGLRLRAEQIRQTLVEEGRAVALARCPKCKTVIELTEIPKHLPKVYEPLKVRCPAGHKVQDFQFAIPEDAEALRKELAS